MALASTLVDCPSGGADLSRVRFLPRFRLGVVQALRSGVAVAHPGPGTGYAGEEIFVKEWAECGQACGEDADVGFDAEPDCGIDNRPCARASERDYIKLTRSYGAGE